jgi:hypothetical protein
MYCGIYRVARRAATRVYPTESNFGPAAPFDTSTDVTGSISPQTPTSMRAQPDIVPEVHRVMSLESFPIRPIRVSTSKSHLKAIKTLSIIMLMYLILWGPFFTIHFFGAVYGELKNGDVLEIVCTWLAYSSFALNPFLYGWMNRTIREELLKMFRSLLFCWKSPVINIDEVEDCPHSGEDFFQFLERTSTMKPRCPSPFTNHHLNTSMADQLPTITDTPDPYV